MLLTNREGVGALGLPVGLGEEDRDELATMPPSIASEEAGMLRRPRLGSTSSRILQAQVFGSLFGGAAPAKTLGRYLVLDALGSGAMGVVMRGHDCELDRPVALKVLHDDLEVRHAARLRREARALAKLSHPNVVQVYEIGQLEGCTFVVMELVEGRTLGQWMGDGPDWTECVEVFLQIGAGLAAAHERGLVHRDFKPSNAILDEQGRPRVLDFGLARQVDVDASHDGVPLAVQRARTDQQAIPFDASLTRTGSVLGTPAYMPPEQMDGQEADARSDQFSFCVALYEAVYGGRPYDGDSMAALRVVMRDGEVRPAPRGARVPDRLRRVLLRGLDPVPERRWATMEELLTELRRMVGPRRRGGPVLALAVGLGLLGLGLAYPDGGEPCTGAALALEGTWDDARRDGARNAIVGTGVPYSEDTWGRVELGLDEYADAWKSRYIAVCEATSVRKEQSPEVMDLRMACLWDRRSALHESIEILMEADEARAMEAVGLVVRLPGLERCDDVAALRSGVPLPSEPADVARVRVLRERLQRSVALHGVRDDERSLRVAGEVLAVAEARGYGHLAAEALLRRGEALDGLARYADAEHELQRAHELAIRHGHGAVEAEAMTKLVWVVGHRRARYDEALGLGRVALTLATSLEIGQMAEAAARNAIGAVLVDQGELDEGLAQFESALHIEEGVLGRDHPSLAADLNNIGAVLVRQVRPEEALAHLRRSLAIEERALGPVHPHVAYASSNLGNVLLMQGKVEEALVHHRRALAIRERALGPDHPELAAALSNVGLALADRGELDEALAHHRRALAIEEGALGPDHPSVAYSYANIGAVLSAQGELEQALLHHRRALAIREAALGPEHPAVATSSNDVGNALVDLGEVEEGSTFLRRSLAIREAVLGPEHPDVVYSLLDIGKVELRRGDFGGARAHAERALAILDSIEAPAELAELRFLLARASWPERGERARARALAEQALATLAEIGPGHEEERAEIERWLAKEHGVTTP